jgi:hypothetical protein
MMREHGFFPALGFLLACFSMVPEIGFPEEPVSPAVVELWADFDPRKDPLEEEVIREWREEGAVFRQVRFLVGIFKGRPARMAAIYGFPEGAGAKLPAVMHIHGGGQRASLHEVKFLVGRGYAALSVNWGGSGDGKPPFHAPDGAEPGDPNTDWGAVDPSQLNVPGYHSILPGPKQFAEDRESPKNCNWYLLTLGCRRGLTFLERQKEVDPGRLGVHGFSMGGNLTLYVAGSDDRVKAAVPAVGGAGWRGEPHAFLGGTAQPEQVRGDAARFSDALGFENYAPLIRCPLLHRSATNDFHGWMDDVYRTNARIKNQPVRSSWSVHLNHRLEPESAVTMPLWFDHFLKNGPALPDTPETSLTLAPEPELLVRPDGKTLPIARVEIFYSVDPDPRARFWRSAEVMSTREGYRGRLPIHDTGLPLFAFANVYHTLPRPESLAALPGYAKPVTEVCLSSLLHSHSSDEVRSANPALRAAPSLQIADFSTGARDWYVLNEGNPTHRQMWTRKVTDPLYRGPDGAGLVVTLKMPRENRLSIVLQQNEWRGYRGPRRTFVCHRLIPGAETPQVLEFELSDFASGEGSPSTWRELDQLGICAHFDAAGGEPKRWNGPSPEFLRVEWRLP